MLLDAIHQLHKLYGELRPYFLDVKTNILITSNISPSITCSEEEEYK